MRIITVFLSGSSKRKRLRIAAGVSWEGLLNAVGKKLNVVGRVTGLADEGGAEIEEVDEIRDMDNVEVYVDGGGDDATASHAGSTEDQLRSPALSAMSSRSVGSSVSHQLGESWHGHHGHPPLPSPGVSSQSSQQQQGGRGLPHLDSGMRAAMQAAGAGVAAAVAVGGGVLAPAGGSSAAAAGALQAAARGSVERAARRRQQQQAQIGGGDGGDGASAAGTTGHDRDSRSVRSGGASSTGAASGSGSAGAATDDGGRHSRGSHPTRGDDDAHSDGRGSRDRRSAHRQAQGRRASDRHCDAGAGSGGDGGGLSPEEHPEDDDGGGWGWHADDVHSRNGGERRGRDSELHVSAGSGGGVGAGAGGLERGHYDDRVDGSGDFGDTADGGGDFGDGGTPHASSPADLTAHSAFVQSNLRGVRLGDGDAAGVPLQAHLKRSAPTFSWDELDGAHIVKGLQELLEEEPADEDAVLAGLRVFARRATHSANSELPGTVAAMLLAIRTFTSNAAVVGRAVAVIIGLTNSNTGTSRARAANKDLIARAGGVGALVDVMRLHPDKRVLQQDVVIALNNLAVKAPKNKDVIAESGAVRCIVAAMYKYEDTAELLEPACSALGTLAVGSGRNKELIVAQHGAEALVKAMLRHPRHARIQYCGSAALNNLALNHTDHKRRIVEEGGIQALTDAMRYHLDDANIQFSCCSALKTLAMKNSQHKPILVHSSAVALVNAARQAHRGSPQVQKEAQLALKSMAWWVYDEEVLQCANCDVEFGVFTRRHHCRSCGRIMCDDCTPFRHALPELGLYDDTEEVRLCRACYRQVRDPGDDAASDVGGGGGGGGGRGGVSGERHSLSATVDGMHSLGM